ncbi:MAG: hypothetical protein JNK37_11460 [Verrucomicrobiales bacterium]|nr:hypothetical protein [Verrucomicrobiales bacterium]
MKTITLKVTEDEERLIREAARQAGMTVSSYLKRRIRGAEPIGIVRSSATGAPAFSSQAQSAPLTTESVGAMLADFP